MRALVQSSATIPLLLLLLWLVNACDTAGAARASLPDDASGFDLPSDSAGVEADVVDRGVGSADSSDSSAGAPALDDAPRDIASLPEGRFLALGDSYTIGTRVPAEDRWPAR